MLRLNNQDDGCDEVNPAEDGVEHTCANAFCIAFTDKMDRTYQHHHHQQCKDGEMSYGNRCVIEWCLEISELTEMVGNITEIPLV